MVRQFRINRVYHKEKSISNRFVVNSPFHACQRVAADHIYRFSVRREGYGPLRSGAPRMHRFASIREGRINIDGVDQGLGSMNQGFGASGTDSGPLESINDPVSRVHFYFR